MHVYFSRLVILCTIKAFTSVLLNFLSILYEKTYISYFTHPLLQNAHISLSILHIYSIKIFIILLIFIIHSLIAPLSLRPTATITTTITTQPLSSETKEKSNQPTHTDQPTRKIKFNIRSTNTDQPTQRKINADQNAIVSMPPRLHTYPDQPTTQINPDQANPHKPRPTHTINSD